MDFKEATDRLFPCVTAAQLAEELRKAGVQIGAQSLRQARLESDKDGHRSAPGGWEPVVARLAREISQDLAALAGELEECPEE